MVYVEVSVLSNIPKNLIYKISSEEGLSIGKLVFVKVKGKVYPAFIVKVYHRNPTSFCEEKIEEIYSISPYSPFFDEKMLSFYQFASYYYFTPLSTVLSNAFPKLGYYKIKESIEIGSSELIFKIKEEVFFSLSRKTSFSYLHQCDSEEIRATEDQKQVIEIIKENRDTSNSFLLTGRTATGKTALLLLAGKSFYDMGRSILFMIPEIGLAPHIYRRAASMFPKEDIIIWHSSLTNAERRYVLERARKGKAILIGTRSSIFVPLKDIGIVIIDEEQDPSYKSDTSFAYNSRDLAFVLSKIYKIPLILSSATPAIETYHKVKRGQIKLLSLKNRIFNEKKDSIIIDTKSSEMVNPFLSKRLINEIEKNLQSNEQSLLFINRRGYAPYAYCDYCKKFIECKNCTVALTWHKSKNLLICHHCGRSIKPLTLCPHCNRTNISYFGAGTEKIAEMIEEIFPSANILKIDRDSLEKRDFFKRHLEGIIRGDYQILIGTQIITKGIHLPNLTLVGILLGEQGLSIPDFRAQERIFQLITQVSGRAGREKKGRVLIQTTMPNSPLFKLAFDDNYEEFYKLETESRLATYFPPFSRILVIKIRGRDEDKVKEASSKIFFTLQKNNKDKLLILYPPMPAPIYIERGDHRYQIYLKAEKPKILIKAIQKLKEEITIPSGIHVSYDIDAYNLL